MGRGALVVCVSVSHGNTAAVARAIGTVLGAEICEPEDVDPQTLAGYDVVGFGSGIFAMSHHPRLRRFIEGLPDVRGTKAFLFTTSGQGYSQTRPWQRPLGSILQGKGYDVVGSFDCRGYDTWLPLRLVGGINKGHPDAVDLTRAFEFAQGLAAEVGPARRRSRDARARRSRSSP